MTNAAGQIWPHLQNDAVPPKPPQQRTSPLAQAMYPALSSQVKTRLDWRERDRQKLLEGLRELNRKIDARMQREGRR